MLKAAVYVPPDLLLTSHFAKECIAYGIRRGYPQPDVHRSWDAIHALLLAGVIQVVIVARREHCAGVAGVWPEVVEEECLATVVLLANRQAARSGPGRHRASRGSNRRPMPPVTTDQLIDDAVRRWRFGLLRRRPDSSGRFPRSGHR